MVSRYDYTLSRPVRRRVVDIAKQLYCKESIENAETLRTRHDLHPPSTSYDLNSGGRSDFIELLRALNTMNVFRMACNFSQSFLRS